MEYKTFHSERIDEVYQIYRENQWSEYLSDKNKLSRAFEQSLYVLGAFEKNQLVGLARCIGDGEFILYVQDIIVKPSHHRKGIGRELMRRLSLKYPTIRQFMLITDKNDDISNAFYQSLGFSKDLNGYPINHYFRSQPID
ncbi:GNAT family N-acetyltransferase [Streptococcus sp. CSL7591-lung]|uniref:GNAT family N-acetyltransferase n=1 Tax=Streptococcus pacificus TaxID=2740577 RepID=A0ABS0ZJ11_9STRE|nr:GNAT family N-acetyltransferase [Streptococcus pacificus]